MAIAVALTPTVSITAPNENKSDAEKVISAKIFSEIKSPSSLSSFKVPEYPDSRFGHSTLSIIKKIKFWSEKEVTYTNINKGQCPIKLI